MNRLKPLCRPRAISRPRSERLRSLQIAAHLASRTPAQDHPAGLQWCKPRLASVLPLTHRNTSREGLYAKSSSRNSWVKRCFP